MLTVYCTGSGDDAAATRILTRVERRPRRILLAEDDLEMRRWVADSLRRLAYDVIEVRSGTEMLELLADLMVGSAPRPAFDLVISDQRMPGFTGLEILAGLREFDAAPPFILITGFGGTDFGEEALRAGARAVLDKPFEMRELLKLVRSLIGPSVL